MKSAENRTRFRDANPLDWAVDRRVFLKRAMRSDFVVIACIGDQQPAQVSLAEDDGVVKALAANGPNQSFGKPVLPRRARCDGFVANAHCTHPLANNRAKDLVPVADQEFWR